MIAHSSAGTVSTCGNVPVGFIIVRVDENEKPPPYTWPRLSMSPPMKSGRWPTVRAMGVHLHRKIIVRHRRIAINFPKLRRHRAMRFQ